MFDAVHNSNYTDFSGEVHKHLLRRNKIIANRP